MTDAHKNAGRFKGFAGLYHDARPACPEYVTDVLTRYLGRRPVTIVDMGCGTGLSTLVWKNKADQIIGVDPSEDMLKQAAANAEQAPDIEFAQAFSDNTGLDGGIADIVTCSQSFHWMEPTSTLREARRLLKSGGIFAAYDCDWPPVCNAAVESAYLALDELVDEIEAAVSEYREAFVQYPKSRHLENIRKSGHFAYAREIVFANSENCSADRYYRIALSQGGTQAILKKNPALIENEMNAFRAAADKFFGDQVLPVEFCYRMRLGVAK
ncbi:MAG: class I SAM-dependent methyltransferase [Oscillospiraceae bacterium]|nr:class I SAM-dependent methyltransferase [Oscillospiraceae bacterium]